MAVRFEDLTYSNEELEKDAIHYLTEQVYEPSYVKKVKDFIADDAIDFKYFYDDDEYRFLNLFYDEYQSGYVEVGDSKIKNTNFHRLNECLERELGHIYAPEEHIEKYAFLLDAEFRKNAFRSHMEAYFNELDAVVATVMVGYSRNPLFSIYAMVREWCMAMHLKLMHPMMVRKFGWRYQNIRFNTVANERLRLLIDFRDKYQHIFKNIGILRAIHSSVFAYAYLYLKAVQTREVLTAEKFILDSSSSKISLLLQGESIQNFDFPVTKYVLDKLKEGMYENLMYEDGRINWNALYVFTFDAIKEAGFEGVEFFGYDGIEAKTMQSYWNKSANMQSMLKILRLLALENNNPVFKRLIEGCEYRLARPNKAKDQMEAFIEETRKIMAARARELTHPRTMSQDLLSAFPSVFLVYFQWHHNFRNIYPKVPKSKERELQNMAQKTKQNQEYTLKNMLKEQNESKKLMTQNEKDKTLQKDNEYNDKMRAILMNKERTMSEISGEKSREQKAANSTIAAEMVNQKQNSY